MIKALKYIILLVTFYFLQLSFCYAQVSIRFEVKDNIEKQALAYATINIKGKELVRVTKLTDSAGVFSLTIKEPDSLIVETSFIGFLKKESSYYTTKDTVFTIYLESRQKMLNEVEIGGRRNNFERKVDRSVLSLNPKFDKGKSAVDLMRKLPFISVTSNNLLIKGDSKYVIYKDGSPSSLTFMDLKTLTANQVESIEVIYYPSARYEGEIEQVVNIIMRKEVNSTSLSSWIGVGNRSHTGLRDNSLGASYAVWKAGKSHKIDFSMMTNSIKSYNNYAYQTSYITSLNQKEEAFAQNHYLNFGYNFETFLKKNQELGLGIKLSKVKNATNSLYLIQESTPTKFDNRTSLDVNTAIINANYTKSFKKDEKLFFSNMLTVGITENGLKSISESLDQIRNKNKIDNSSLVSQLTFEKKSVENWDIVVGAGIIARSFSQKTNYSNKNDASLVYNQLVTNEFLSVSKNLKQFFFRIGGRMEQTMNRINDTSSLQFLNNFLPRLLISKRFSDNYSLTVNYSNAIQRPNFTLLSTFQNMANPLQVITGNPNLVNELHHNFSIENALTVGGFDLNLGLEANSGKDLISSTRTVEESFLNIVYSNISNSKSIGFVYSLNKASNNGEWYFFSSGNINFFQIKSSQEKNKGITYGINGGLSYTPNDKLTIDYFLSLLENRFTLQSNLGNSIYMDLMLNYSLGKHSTLTLRSQNPIVNLIHTKNNTKAESVVINHKESYFGRTIEISYTYVFGKSKNKSNLRKAEEKDLKSKE